MLDLHVTRCSVPLIKTPHRSILQVYMNGVIFLSLFSYVPLKSNQQPFLQSEVMKQNFCALLPSNTVFCKPLIYGHLGSWTKHRRTITLLCWTNASFWWHTTREVSSYLRWSTIVTFPYTQHSLYTTLELNYHYVCTYKVSVYTNGNLHQLGWGSRGLNMKQR